MVLDLVLMTTASKHYFLLLINVTELPVDGASNILAQQMTAMIKDMSGR